tara:strand:- start:19492 stop:20184 length:693 start_codon:yes stop_codon:yes gene_type:complete
MNKTIGKMILDNLKKPRHVTEYDITKPLISKDVISELLKNAYEVTPSKNNIVAWQVHVLGPEHQKYKDIIYDKSCDNDTRMNKGNTEFEDIASGTERKDVNYANLTSCQYLLIITQRLGTLTSTYQKLAWKRGIFFDPCTEKGLEDSREPICVESGMFAMAFRGLAAEKGIDTSFTGNFSRSPEHWKELPFIDRRVNLMITVGHAKKYRRETFPIDYDYKPNYEDIIKWI